jgi:hypothetical protein
VGPDPHATVLQDLLHTNHAAAAEDLYQASNLDFKRTDVDLQPRVQMQQAERKRQVGQMGEGKRRTWRGRRPWASRCFCAAAAAATLQRCGRLHLQREDSLFCRVHQRAAGATTVGRSTQHPRAPRFSHDRGRVAQHPRAGAPVLPRQRSSDDRLPATPVAAPVPPTHSFLLLVIYSQIAKRNFI